jgi:aconitate hydratase
MVRGTFASVRIHNRLLRGTEGGVTTYLPAGEVATIDVAPGGQEPGLRQLLAGREPPRVAVGGQGGHEH